MTMTNWNSLDKKMQQWASSLISEVKLRENETNRVASLIATEIARIPIDSKKEIIRSISNPISIQDRLDELTAFQGWMDMAHTSRSACITRAQVIVQNYVCFVYLSEACFKTLRKHVQPSAVTKRCCNFLINNPVRAFRNALAHSNWKYNDDFSSIIYYARKGDQPNESIIEWSVSNEDLDFWQALARCTAYTSFSCLKS